MKKLYLLIILCMVILLSSCAKPEDIYSEVMQATGTIIKVHHEDASSEVVLSYSGKPSVKNIPESFEVVIEWDHGPTKLSTKDEYNKYKEHKGDQVTITYREFHTAYYDEDTGELEYTSPIKYQISNIQIN